MAAAVDFFEATDLFAADLAALVLALLDLAAQTVELGSKAPTAMASATERIEKWGVYMVFIGKTPIVADCHPLFERLRGCIH